ncbi:2729_t:CDS:2 [Acaulospora morrowiae]|uniref:2729_t:CDS:1 n=1 Tax=Acaulospora morrowiae TaxID=94023 RepID=A0A9N8VHY7_9GLOM|nr:2729_t:CDS:2 [Acaulospora morrowiae]
MSFLRTKFTELLKDVGVRYPIVSGPMDFVTSVELATQVTLAGGLGFIPAGSETADKLDRDLAKAKQLLNNSSEILPIGVGFKNFVLHSQSSKAGGNEKCIPPPLETILSHKPAAVWFSFGDFHEYIPIVREMSPKTKIFSQVGTVETAIASANLGVDVIVMQGNDSGGHGLVNNASVVTLVPEAIDALKDHKNGHIPVLAAGGIMDGRGLVAMLAFGSSGVVMGTRFAASKESLSKPIAKEMFVNAHDGGVSTVRTSVFDKMKQPNLWPSQFDGRALRNKTLEEGDVDPGDEEKIAERRRIYSEAMKNGDYSRAVIYAGTGVGLIKEILSAKEIVETTIDEAKNIMKGFAMP